MQAKKSGNLGSDQLRRSEPNSMGDHYLPQHYLNGFTIDERLWVHDLERKLTRRGKPKSEANVNDLWPGELERHLAEKIEGPAQDTIDRIRRFEPIDDSEREALSTYLITMWKRVPAGRDRTASHIPQLAAEHKQGYFSQIEGMVADGSMSVDQGAEARQKVSDILEGLVDGPPDYYWHHALRDGATPKMMSALRGMNWTFLVSTSDPYLTCDDPLFFFRNIGIGRVNSELSVPLSTSITLLAHQQCAKSRQFQDARAGMVVQLNRRTAHNARRFIYSAEPVPWAIKLGTRKLRPERIKIFNN
ncbi:DUF4238 domain-containing protein [Xanthomonas arboricola]|uniref:DUF4238 domain-containing protein n=1 Tax=Xanthomonas arboricola TaxID=56448 RepID=UPI0009B82607|nr:DUF4238 domain-containing protein [Xanthomonas arboricola]